MAARDRRTGAWQGQPHQDRARRWATWPVALVLVWAALAVADVIFILPSGATPGATASQHHRTGHSRPIGSRHHSRSGRHQHHRAKPPTHRAAPVVALLPVSASAFGPSGPGSGDNSTGASLAIDASQSTAWHSDWYRSAAFGNLQAGTGLLIDMGKQVKVTRLTITLAAQRGADLTVLAERAPGVPDGRGQAFARDVGGTVRLRLARPRQERYLLIWFSLLPPDSAGTYEAIVYNVAIKGIR